MGKYTDPTNPLFEDLCEVLEKANKDKDITALYFEAKVLLNLLDNIASEAIRARALVERAAGVLREKLDAK